MLACTEALCRTFWRLAGGKLCVDGKALLSSFDVLAFVGVFSIDE
jgi:hypothetical protein